MKWEEVTLGAVSLTKEYGYTESATREKVGPKFLRITDIVSPNINWNTVPYCPISSENFKKYKLENGDILIARTGATSGYNTIFEENIDAVFASYLIRFRIDTKIAFPKYIHYVLQSPAYVGFISGAIGGSAQPGINAKTLSSFSFPLPPLETQKKIAAVLSSLDDKIELNTRMNKVLEEIAQVIFKRWFVEFEFPNERGEPYRSSGGKMIESELGLIPEGWGVKMLGDVTNIYGGGTPSTSNPDFWEGGNLPFCTPKDLSELSTPILLDTERHITELGMQSISSKQLPTGTLLLSSRAPIGYLAITMTPVSINQGFIAMICNGDISNIFMYLLLHENLEIIKGRANGSTFLEINKQNFRTIEIINPDTLILKKFGELVNPLFEKITEMTKETVHLTAIRDALLPKLMNGEIEV